MKKNCGWVNYKWIIVQNNSVIKNKIKVELDLSNYPTKKRLEHATGVDAFNLAAKKDFIALKAKFDKLDQNCKNFHFSMI